MTKKLIASFVLILTFLAVSVSANGQIMTTAGKCTPGGTVEVSVNIEENPGIISMLLHVSYDSRYFTLTDVKDEGNLGTACHGNSYKNNPYVLSWANDTAAQDNTFVGKIATLTFEVAEDTPLGTYPVNITTNYDNDEIYNFNLEGVSFDIQSSVAAVNGNTEITDVSNSKNGVSVEFETSAVSEVTVVASVYRNSTFVGFASENISSVGGKNTVVLTGLDIQSGDTVRAMIFDGLDINNLSPLCKALDVAAE